MLSRPAANIVSELPDPRGGKLVSEGPPVWGQSKAAAEVKAVTKHRIRMIETKQGKDDDPTAPVRTYQAHEVYEVGPALRRAFVQDLRCAEDVADEADPPAAQVRPGADRVTKVEGPAETKPAGRDRRPKRRR